MLRIPIFILLFLPGLLLAQNAVILVKPDTASRKVIYDQPEKIRRIFLGFQPMYADIFSSTVNAGFGLEAMYLPKTGKMDFKVSFRKPYSNRFYDQSRDNMEKLSNTLNRPVGFLFFEFNATWHLRDQTRSKHGVVSLVKKQKNQSVAWNQATGVLIPFKTRTINGLRAGFQAWQSSLDVTATLEKQGSRNADIALPEEYVDVNGSIQRFKAFSSIYAQAFFTGYSITRIKNYSVLFDGYETAINDEIITFYGDLLFANKITLQDAFVDINTYNLEKIELRKIGFRAGIDFKTNRKVGWGYSAEIGIRPAPKQQAGFFLLKLSLPVRAGYLIRRDKKVSS